MIILNSKEKEFLDNFHQRQFSFYSFFFLLSLLFDYVKTIFSQITKFKFETLTQITNFKSMNSHDINYENRTKNQASKNIYVTNLHKSM